MKLRGFTRALRALAALSCVAVMFVGNLPFGPEPAHAQATNQLASLTALPADGQTATYKGTNKVADVGNIFVGDDDVENVSAPIDIQKDTVVGFSVSFTNVNSDMDFFIFKLPQGAGVGDLSDADVVDSSALSGNPEYTGPSRFGVASASPKVEETYAFGPGKYVIGLSIFDDPSVQPTDWTLTVTAGGTTEELIGDVGLPNSGVNTGTSSPTVIQVNRTTPSKYPFKVTGARFANFRFQGQPTPVGRTLDVIVFTAPTGTTPPANPNMTIATITLTKTGQWVDYPIANGPTATTGQDVYVGYRFSTAGTGIFPTIDVGRNKLDRSFISRNNGATWSALLLTSGNPADLTNRVTGTVGP